VKREKAGKKEERRGRGVTGQLEGRRREPDDLSHRGLEDPSKKTTYIRTTKKQKKENGGWLSRS